MVIFVGMVETRVAVEELLEDGDGLEVMGVTEMGGGEEKDWPGLGEGDRGGGQNLVEGL